MFFVLFSGVTFGVSSCTKFQIFRGSAQNPAGGAAGGEGELYLTLGPSALRAEASPPSM